jgi:hypothetical protein
MPRPSWVCERQVQACSEARPNTFQKAEFETASFTSNIEQAEILIMQACRCTRDHRRASSSTHGFEDPQHVAPEERYAKQESRERAAARTGASVAHRLDEPEHSNA